MDAGDSAIGALDVAKDRRGGLDKAVAKSLPMDGAGATVQQFRETSGAAQLKGVLEEGAVDEDGRPSAPTRVDCLNDR